MRIIKDLFLGGAFRVWNCRGTFSGGGSFRSGVQPPTGTKFNPRPAPTGTGGAVVRDSFTHSEIGTTGNVIQFASAKLRRGTEAVITALTRNQMVGETRHAGSNPALSAISHHPHPLPTPTPAPFPSPSSPPPRHPLINLPGLRPPQPGGRRRPGCCRCGRRRPESLPPNPFRVPRR